MLSLDYGATEAEFQEHKASVRAQTLDVLKLRVDEEVAEQNFYPKLRRRFETLFKYDEAHRPRIWRDLEEISPKFDVAKLGVRPPSFCFFVCVIFSFFFFSFVFSPQAAKMLNLFVKPDEHLDLSVLVPDADWGILIPESKKSLVI